MAKAYVCRDFALLLAFIVVTGALACQPRANPACQTGASWVRGELTSELNSAK